MLLIEQGLFFHSLCANFTHDVSSQMNAGERRANRSLLVRGLPNSG